ncbi:RNA helicase [Malassezia pachydermatis]|uniref:RNA helicase n=1 Tax=Malassezia pachydermatis TaxID=77020 RepID=A0A0M8MUT5_9BASI|nr:p-loop containing nucleoside triphosphate hydrolase protein [Malassezia pachydermatis]KOS14200.1 p-loop containing nucleoside triphosphate hydrolase protein [Malassezia pachydermatis]
MAKKKKLQLKSNVQRGFATTSVPKRDTGKTTDTKADDSAPSAAATSSSTVAEVASHAAEIDAAMQDPSPADASQDKSTGDTYDPEAEEIQALQNLVEMIYPRVEKEVQRRSKTVDLQQRFAKSIQAVSFPIDVRDTALRFARHENDGLRGDIDLPPCQDVNDPVLAGMLGRSTAAESEAKELEHALIVWEMLRTLGFSRHHATVALQYAPNLDVEECVAWLLTQLDAEEYRKLSFHVDTPQDHVISRAAAMDTSVPPPSSWYDFTRVEREGFAAHTSQGDKEETSKAKVDDTIDTDRVSEAQVTALTTKARALITELHALLDEDSPCLDIVEYPNEAWSTARIMSLQIEQDRTQRRRTLGGTPSEALKQALDHDALEKQLTQLLQRANDVMQQSEMQPDFRRPLAQQRFKERMKQRQDEEAAQAQAQKAEEAARAQRRREIEKLEQPDEDNDEPIDALEDEGALDLLETAAAEESVTAGSHVQIRDIATQGAQRTPRALLSDAVQQNDPHARIKYTPVSSGGQVHRSRVDIAWSAKGNRPAYVDSFALTTQGCTSRVLADDLVATLALNCVGREKHIVRQLGTGFRACWDELEAARATQKDAFLRDEVLHVRHVLSLREASATPAALDKAAKERAKPSREKATNSMTTLSQAQPDPALAEMWADRQARDAYVAMLRGRQDLPIFQARQQILDSVAQSQVVVLSGETGCGKSTQLPAYLLEDCLSRGERCKIYVTEPRRISAMSLAERVSQELGEAPKSVGTGDSLVGYAIRLESQIGPQARLVYATTGIVLRMLESSVLDEVTHIIIDEVHERSIESDFLLIVLKSLMRQRPDLKVVLMSATLDAHRISEYFGGCPTLSVPGRTFPVDSYFLEDALELCDYTLEPDSPYARTDERTNKVDVRSADAEDAGEEDEDEVAEADPAPGSAIDAVTYSSKTVDTLAHLNEHKINYELITLLLLRICTDQAYASMSRAILVFLPGMGEIRECLRHLGEHAEFQQGCVTHVLHSSVASEDQSAAFLPPPPGQRKIVLATNIAETGITIPDITCVIDSGRHREMRYDEKRKISRLVECFVAQSNAKQRRGRAGRVQHGLCFHLFTRKRYDEYLDPHPLPEMLRLSLQELALQLKVMPLQIGRSVEDALSQALDPPQPANIQRAVASLVEVEALTPTEAITPLGRHLCHMPLDVHLAKFLLIAALFRCTDAALTIAALLNAKSPFLKTLGQETGRGRAAFQHGEPSDFLAFVSMYRAWRAAVGRQQGRAFCASHGLSADALYQMEELRQQYLAYLVDTGFVRVDASVRHDLVRRRTRHGRPRLMEIPAHLDTYSQSGAVITLALVAAMYPKLLIVDEKTQQMRTLTNNQPAVIHPSSVNARKPLGTPSTHFVLYHSIVYSHRLYAWDTAAVDDRMVLLVGGEAEFKHTSRSVYIDHNRIRMATYDASSLVALRLLRDQLRQLMHASFRKPGTPWTPAQEHIFSLVLALIGADTKTIPEAT